MAKKWYVVHTYSGHENRARLSLLDRIRTHTMQDDFGEILIPTESVLEVVPRFARMVGPAAEVVSAQP